ncbi:intracellular hyaluronan-binding protein 4.S-like isoform X1 [Haemaphysalis longicornis]
MESSYGIGVKNRYELFYDDEEDPTELLRQQELEKERRKAEKTTTKDKSKGTAGAPQKGVKAPASAAGKKTAKEIPVNKAQERSIAPRDDNKQQRTARPDRAVKFAAPTGRENQQDFEERKNRRNREDRITSGGPDSRFEYGSRDRGDGEIRRGGRGGGLGGRGGFPRRGGGRGGFVGGPEGGRPGPGGGRGGGFDGRGKREFERQSGSDRSGVKPVDKKGGEGSYNWGTVNDDLEVQLSPFGEENAVEAADKSSDEAALAGDNAADASASSKDGFPPGEEGSAETASEDAKEMTLDEYKREQEQKRSRASFNIRKPGEGGEEKAEWKRMFVLKKKVSDEDGEDAEDDDEDDSEEEDEYMRRGRQRQLVDIEINFADQRRGRGGRGGRGLGRGGPGRGSFGGPRGPPRDGDRAGDRPPRGGGYGARGDRTGGGEPPKQSAPKVDDWNDFPSLVAA